MQRFDLLGDDVRANLLEARLYIDSAAADALVGRNAFGMSNDLRVADEYLSEAEADEPDSIKPRVSAVRTEVEALLSAVDAKPVGGGLPTRDEFERVVNDLRALTP